MNNKTADGVRELLLASGWAEVTWAQAGDACLVCKYVNYRHRKWAKPDERKASRVYGLASAHYHIVIIDEFDSQPAACVLLPFSKDKEAIEITQKIDIDWGKVADQIPGAVYISKPPVNAGKMDESSSILYALMLVHQKWIKVLELNNMGAMCEAMRCAVDRTDRRVKEIAGDQDQQG